MIEMEKIIPALKDLNLEISETYKGIHFTWNRKFYDESEEYAKKYEELKRKKELLLKPIFGS